MGTQGRGVVARRGEWLALVTVFLAVLGLSVSSPPFAGPDEAAHQATASYLTVHLMPPEAETRDYVSGMLQFGDCQIGFDSQQDASCLPGREAVAPVKERILNYPPPYYWAIGLGQKFAPGADTWMDVGGRAASAVLNLVVIGLLAALMYRRVRGWGTNLLLVTTPVVAFMWAVVNPNGWEITTGLLFAYVMALAWWDSEEFAGRIRRLWVACGAVAVAAVLFALSRHDALVWLCLIVLSVVLLGPRCGEPRRRIALLLAAGVGILAGLVWQMTHPAQHIVNNPDRVADPTWLDHLHWLAQIDEVLPDRLRQMVGVLGWLDTPVPQFMALTLMLGWAALIGFMCARTRVSLPAVALGLLGTLFVPSLMEMIRWNDWPYWYQGRITLSFTVPFLLLILLRYGAKTYWATVLLSVANGLVLAFMVWQNTARYAFGVKDYIPLRWSDPALGGVEFWTALACSCLIAVVSLVRLYWWFRRNRSGLEGVTVHG